MTSLLSPAEILRELALLGAAFPGAIPKETAAVWCDTIRRRCPHAIADDLRRAREQLINEEGGRPRMRHLRERIDLHTKNRCMREDRQLPAEASNPELAERAAGAIARLLADRNFAALQDDFARHMGNDE